MKILYGVQATGNGHITRARALNKWFSSFDIEVDFLFSGRKKEALWDMEEFGQWRCYRGLSFVHNAGKLDTFETIKTNSIKTLYHDIKTIDLSPYDLVITDFEPITAWAAKRQNKTCIGIGHQYAFNHDVPKAGGDFIASQIMRYFAPTSIGLGLHWHHFDSPILPPIAETHHTELQCTPDKVIVYLGFEEPEEVLQLLEPFTDTQFTFYGPFEKFETQGHIQLKPLSREGFKEDLASASGVMCNAGFELASEAIQLGKQLLVKPLAGQMEQVSNAVALEQLGLGMSMDTLDPAKLKAWLSSSSSVRVQYPDVAKAIVEWLSLRDWHNQESINTLIDNLWRDTKSNGELSFDRKKTPTSSSGKSNYTDDALLKRE